jgi:hypothetical protein
MGMTPENVNNNISTTFHEELYHEVNNNWKPVTLCFLCYLSNPTELLKPVKLLPHSRTFGTSNWYSILTSLKQTDTSSSKSSKPM